jgi:hypothetical protein
MYERFLTNDEPAVIILVSLKARNYNIIREVIIVAKFVICQVSRIRIRNARLNPEGGVENGKKTKLQRCWC